MASCRRSLTANVSRLSRRFHPSFSHALHHLDGDGDRTNPHPAPSPIPSPPRAPPFSRSLLHARSTAFSSAFPHSLRFYSSGTGGGTDVSYVKDVAEVLTDNGVEVAASAAAAVPAPVVGEVAVAAADSFPPVAALQHLIDGVHSFTGLNWWAAIALTTVLIRTATVPLLINQMRATVKLNKMRPELEELKEQMQNSTDPESLQKGQKQMKALFVKHGVTPFTPLKGMFIQGPVFISFYLAISNMVEKVPSFKGGGAFWFTDLTTPDPMYALPTLTALTFWITVELNMQEGMEGNPMVNTMKNFSRVLALMTVPFTSQFPKAIFCYWITSNLFSLGYGFLMKRPPVRKYLNLPDIISQPSSSPQPSFSFLGGSKSIAPTVSPVPLEQSEQAKFQDRRVSPSCIMSHRIRNLEKAVKGRTKSKKR